MLLSVISPKKPASWLLWKKDWSQPSAASLSKKKKWTPALKPCSRPDAHPLDRPTADDLLNIKNYLQQNYPHFAEPTVRAIYQHIRLLTTSPNRRNRGRPGHRSGTK